jgi:hypothetical protein
MTPVAVSAANFHYQYAELSYQRTTAHVGNGAKGPAIQFAYSFSGMDLQLLAGVARLDTPASPADINGHNYWVGFRGEDSFGDNTDFYTDILYLNNRTTIQSSSNTDNGYQLTLGVRHRMAQRLEFDASASHYYLAQGINEAAVGLVFNATGHLALGISYAHNSLLDNTATLRFRVYY